MAYRPRRTIALGAVSAVLALGTIGAAGAPVAATDDASPGIVVVDPEKVISHFLCYRGKMGGFSNDDDARDIHVVDGWIDVAAQVRRGEAFCNPVRKKKGKVVLARIRAPRQHLKVYDLTTGSELVSAQILVTNQFGSAQFMRIEGGPESLAVPTRKIAHKFPRGLDHFVCHEVINGGLLDRRFKLRDQFRNHRGTDIGNAYAYCSSADKAHGSTTFLRRHPDIGLACYAVKAERGRFKRRASNQFERRKRFTARRPIGLCVPSTASIAP